MGVLAALKTLSLFFEAMKFRAHQTAGAPSGWDV
eukprot:gene5135-57064_t